LACGSPGTGDCLVPNGSPYCEDAACCEAVCAVDPYCCEVEWDAVCANSVFSFPTECGAREVLLSAVSRKDHGTAGPFDINLPVNTYADAGIESRSGGPTQVVLTFSGPVDGLNVQASSGSVEAILTNGAEATVELTGVENATCLALEVSGASLRADAKINVRCLVGDVRTDGVVNIFDLVNVRNALNQPVTTANYRADVSADGNINIFDLVAIRNHLNTAAKCTPPTPETMVLIPAGEFQMGDTRNEGESRERPVHVVYVDDFYMERYEVTNQQYADALNWALNQGNLITVINGVVYQADSGTSFPYCITNPTTPESHITWNGRVFGVLVGKDNHPIVQVSWYGAAAFCNWRSEMELRTLCYNLSTWECDFNANGYRLPTEAEWERAARGGAAGWRFPWGNTIQHTRANYYSSTSYSYDTSPTRSYHPLWNAGPHPWTSPVGFFDGSLRYKEDFNWPVSASSYQTVSGANGYGLHDMAGNPREWCNDWYSGSYYSISPHSNPRGPTSGSNRVARGGSWASYAIRCRVAYRDYFGAGTRSSSIGFRCAAGS